MSDTVPALTPSHEFRFAGVGLVRILLPTLAGFVGLVIFLQVLNLLDWLPLPNPPQTGDEFVMRNRYETAVRGDPASLLIIGDSSSVMGVDASLLGELLPERPKVYDLGLFLGLPMEAYAEAAQKFIEHHPNQVRTVVLLTTFSRLKDAKFAGRSVSFWRGLWDHKGARAANEVSALGRILLLGRIRDGLLIRILPFERYSTVGEFFGGIVRARYFVTENRGSAFYRNVYNRQGSREKMRWVPLDREILDQARRVRQMIPPDVEFIYGLMPMPETYSGADAAVHRLDMMLALNTELDADFLLTNTPATMPDGYFSDIVHLNLRGQTTFTRLLARELAHLPIWESNKFQRGEP